MRYRITRYLRRHHIYRSQRRRAEGTAIMATQSKPKGVALWDITVTDDDDDTTFVIAKDGKVAAEKLAAAHLAEMGKPTAKFTLTAAGRSDVPEGIVPPAPAGTLADDLLSGLDRNVQALGADPQVKPAAKRQVKPDPKPGKPGRKQNTAAVRKRKAGTKPGRVTEMTPEATKAAIANAPSAPAKSKAKSSKSPTQVERLAQYVGEAADLWNATEATPGLTVRAARNALKATLDERHPEEAKRDDLFGGRIPYLLKQSGLDGWKLPPKAQAAQADTKTEAPAS